MHKLSLPITLGVLAATGTAWAGLKHNSNSYNSSAWNGTTTNSSAWNGTTTNGSTPNQLATSRTGLHSEKVHAANGRLWLR